MAQHIDQIIQNLSPTGTKAPTTRTPPVSPAWLDALFQPWRTHKDPILCDMLAAAKDFVQAMANPSTKPRRWLSFTGPSGTGKTFMAMMIRDAAKKFHHLTYSDTLINPILVRYWPKLITALRNGEYHWIEDLGDANVVFLDEVVVEHDPSGFVTDKLCDLLSRRVGKWTVITSNLTLEKLQAIDNRIASRMVRDGSVVVECNTTDYALRQ